MQVALPIAKVRHPALAFVGIALLAVALTALPFALASIGTAWVRKIGRAHV